MIYLNITSLVEKAKSDLDTVTRRFVYGMFSRVIMRTPVDTGRARGAWVVGFGAPAFSGGEHLDKGPVTQNGSGNSSTKDRMAAEILQSGSWIGTTVFLTNSLGYPYFLEYGRQYAGGYGPGSKQAPQGMVRITVNEYAEVLGQAMPFARGSLGLEA